MAPLLVMYRYHTLPGARRKAQKNGYEGAQYAWESTLSGDETTPPSMMHPERGDIIAILNAHREIHISASVAYAAWLYWRMTGDVAVRTASHLLVSLPLGLPANELMQRRLVLDALEILLACRTPGMVLRLPHTVWGPN